MNKYFCGFSGYIHPEMEKKRYKSSDGWEISFEEIPKESQFCSTRLPNNTVIPHKAVIIHSMSLDKAIKGFELIYACWILKETEDFTWINDIGSQTCELTESFWTENHSTKDLSSLDIVCLMAVKATRRLEYYYSIFKLFTSYSLFSVHAIDIDPDSIFRLPPKPTLKKSIYSTKDIMIKTCAIIMAYAAIEELGFGVQSHWKDENIEILKKKLLSKKINPEDSVTFQIRGAKTYIEKNVKLNSKPKKADWGKGLIRDVELEIPTAIFWSSYLRSKVAAHGISSDDKYSKRNEKIKRIRTLSDDDVINVQVIARYLVLQFMDIWKLLQ